MVDAEWVGAGGRTEWDNPGYVEARSDEGGAGASDERDSGGEDERGSG